MTPTVQLDEIAEVKLGRQRSPKDHNGDQMRPYVRAANVGWFGWKLEDVKSMNFTDAEMDVYRLEPGDLLLGEASGSAAEVGKPALWQGEIENCAFQNTLIRVRPRAADSRYLLHYFGYCASTGAFARSSRGVGIFHLGRKALAEWQIPLPPIEDQRRIAAVLDAAESLRAKRRQARAKLDTLTQAIFVALLDQNGWDHWPAQSIEAIALPEKGSIRTGPFGSQLLHEEFTDEGIAVLGIDNAVGNEFRWGERRYISPEKYEELKRFTVHPGDVIVTIMGTCGRAAIVPDDIPMAINTKHLCCVTVDATVCVPEWLWACLRFHPDVRRQLGGTHGAVMPGLNMGKIKQAEIPVPPVEVQKHFAALKWNIDGQTEQAKSAAECLDRLFASLQQRAFRGVL